MAMYHDNHPDKDYEMANRVEVFDPPRAIAWQPGPRRPDRLPTISSSADGSGGTTSSLSGQSQTEVTLTYDWSAVPPLIREHIGFPPFDIRIWRTR